MIKRVAFFFLLVVAIACGTWGYFYLTKLKRPTTNPLHVLSDSCYLLLENKNLHDLTKKLNHGNLMWEDLLQNTDIKQLNKTLQKIDSLLSLSGNQFGIQNFYLAFYGQKKNTYLAAFNLNDINTSDAFTSFLKHYFKAQKTGSNRYQCLYMDDSFYVYVNMGFVLFSGDSDFLEKSITRKKGTLAQNKLFMQAYEGIDTESDLTVFVHLPHFYNLAWKELLTTVPPGKKNSQENWISADALISPNEIKAQGFMSNDSSVFYQLIKQQKTVSIKDAFSLLPYSTTQAQVISMLNYPLFIAAGQSNQITSRKAQLSNYSDLLNADAELEIEKFQFLKILRKFFFNDSNISVYFKICTLKNYQYF